MIEQKPAYFTGSEARLSENSEKSVRKKRHTLPMEDARFPLSLLPQPNV